MSATLVHGDLPLELARALQDEGRVAVDTETSGLDWATDELYLCQLFSPTTGAVLVRNVDQPAPRLSALLNDPAVLKVLHYAPFDLKFLEARRGIRVRSVACTKAASRLLSPGLPTADHSLQALLLHHLGVGVSKGPVRTSNWGAPTLSDEQIAYAADDVGHLLDLYEVLRKQISDRDLEELYHQVCAYMPVDAHLTVSGIPNPLAY